MKSFKMAVLGSVFAIPALAADLPAYAPEPVPVSSAYDWSGFYAGVHVGYGWGENGYTASTNPPPPAFSYSTDHDSDGFIGGAQVGFNIQSGNWVFGLEGDFSGSGIDGDATVTPPGFAAISVASDVDWLATVRGRVGYAFDTTLLYATGGLAVGKIEFSYETATDTGSDDDTFLGFAVGAGVEHAFTDRLSGKIEYLYVDLGEETFAGTAADTEVDFTAHTVKVGLNYNF